MPPYTITHAKGELRKAAAAYLERDHYMRSNGGSGTMFAVTADDTDTVQGACLIGATASTNCDRSLVRGACLIGPTGSQDAERNIAKPGVLVRQIKRSHLGDEVPMYESHLLRTAMQAVANDLDRAVLFVSYADPAATDERTGLPLAGWCYLASGFFYAGETTGSRTCVVDHLGRARSTRQGAITLTRRTLPKAGDTFHGEHITSDWRMRKLPPARIWLAVQTPTRMSRAQAKHAWRQVWANLNPARRIAAKQWISHKAWQRQLRDGIVPLGEPTPAQIRPHDRFQPACWPGPSMTRTAAPVWVPLVWQQRLLLEATMAGETTAGRCYAPLNS